MSDDDVLRSWFLMPSERGNEASDIDRRRAGGTAWTTGNHAAALIDGLTYFRRLYEVLCDLKPGDHLCFTDWRGDPDELLAGAGTEVGRVLGDLDAGGIEVYGLVWRSHLNQLGFSEQQSLSLAEEANKSGAQILLDERVRRGGSHHQKLFLIHCAGDERDDIAFVGGIDLCHGRNDGSEHRGDPQPFPLDERYGAKPAWHDVQLEVRGPVLADLDATFRERWEDDTPLDHRNPLRRLLARRARMPSKPGSLGPRAAPSRPTGPHAIQVLRTYPAKRPPYPFAPHGERSIARAYQKAFARARRLIYFEDQYLWSLDLAKVMARRLREEPQLRIIGVVPRYPDQDGFVAGRAHKVGREPVMELLAEAGGDRVLICDIENDRSEPIYVHAKVCVIDDVWAELGSDNMNRRSWTHDSELSCAVIDTTRDRRRPRDPAGLGDEARVFARDLRLGLWREHLGRDSDDGMLDPEDAFELWRRSARALDDWHGDGARGPRPPGRVRIHDLERVGALAKWWAAPVFKLLLDPDGRPRSLRKNGRF